MTIKRFVAAGLLGSALALAALFGSDGGVSLTGSDGGVSNARGGAEVAAAQRAPADGANNDDSI
jgi:hypothetical protein